jgi:hypothetical protein
MEISIGEYPSPAEGGAIIDGYVEQIAQHGDDPRAVPRRARPHPGIAGAVAAVGQFCRDRCTSSTVAERISSTEVSGDG